MPELASSPHALIMILVAAGVFVTWLSRRPGVMQTRSFRLVELLVAAVVVVVAFVWLDHVNGRPDPRREMFMLIVDCLLFGLCFTGGAGSSVLLDNGAVWPDLLLIVRYLGGTLDDVFIVVVVMLSLAVGLTALMTSRLAHPTMALPAAVFALASIAALSLAQPLLDCSVTFLFSTTAAALLLVFGLSGDLVALALAAVIAAHAVNAHTSGVSILPALFFLPALAGRSALRAVAVALCSFLLASLVTSLQSVAGNVVAVTYAGVLPVALLGMVTLLGVGFGLNGFYQRLSASTKAIVVAAAIVGPHLVGVVYLLLVSHPVHPRYLPPVIAPLSMAAALLLGWPARRLLPRSIGYWASFLLPMATSLLFLSVFAW